MKLSPEMKKATHNMQPGVISAEGFLGNETLKLPDIIARDEGEMEKLELSYIKTSALLRYLLEHGERGLGEPVTVDNKWIVQIIEVKGSLPCPFQDCMSHKTAVEIERKESGEKIVFTALSIHLMEEHHFLEGKGSPFRLEPHQLKKILY